MRTDVSFDSAGLTIAGHLYAPDQPATDPRPAIVVSHPAGGVKEQAAGLYARRLAERGFVTLAFDAAHQGQSAGLPRGLEDPGQRIEDIRAATSWLSSGASAGEPGGDIDPERIGVLGICASGGYVVPAVATDPRVRAVAMVSAADIGRQFRQGAQDDQDPAVLRGLLAAAAAARTAEAHGAPAATFPIFPADERQARAGGQHLFDGWEYYRTDRAYHPRSATEFTLSSVDRIAAFDAFRFIDLIAPRPLLMIAGTAAVTQHMTVEAIDRAGEPKRLHWIEGASHVDLYDRDEYVTPAVDVLAEFFGTHLGE